jgi:D-glycero-beta-D-manno-heptose-7-phosphate kinase
MDKKTLSYTAKFKDMKILVIGDVMLDVFKYCSSKGVSAEGPHLDIMYIKTNFFPGGAGNVAANLKDLGAEVYLTSVIGQGENANLLTRSLDSMQIRTDLLVRSLNRITTVKERPVVDDTTLLKISYENRHNLNSSEEEDILNTIGSVIGNVHGIIISDYSKGVITKEVIDDLIASKTNNCNLIVVDPKPRHSELYHDMEIITPNLIEACKIADVKYTRNMNNMDVDVVGKKLIDKFNSFVVITRGGDGASIYFKNGEVQHVLAETRKIYDVCGAGDTFIATLTLARASGADIVEATQIANHAAGIVVGKRGTSTVSLDELVAKLTLTTP